MPDEIPVLVAVGQHTNHSDAVEDFLSPADLAAIAVRECLGDLSEDERASIDTILTCRIFSDSTGYYEAPWGSSSNLPRSIAGRCGIHPEMAIYAIPGGQTPQALVSEQCERIVSGVSKAGTVVGVEALKTTKRSSRMGVELDWHEVVDGQIEDRGLGGFTGMSRYERAHGIGPAISTYTLLEHALRKESGDSVEQHKRRMCEIFSAFSKVAADNPFAQFPIARGVDGLMESVGDNYQLTDIYTKHLVAQDAVDQSGAVLIVAESLADEWGIPTTQRVYLHGYSAVTDVNITERPRVAESRAMKLAVKRALQTAGCAVADIDLFDIYSCFPSAVMCAQDALGIQDMEPGKLTLTGGLAYFGGAGNSYSLHGIIEMVKALRNRAENHYGLVMANGGYMTKVAVGVYSNKRPNEWRPVDCADLQAEIDSAEKPDVAEEFNGSGRITSYSVSLTRGTENSAFILGESAAGERFLAMVAKEDKDTMVDLNACEPLGRKVIVRSEHGRNYFRFG